uniref:Uncharacterized protein n=1 Tax=Parascaris equorum TaxID=6256 RepID=A0A914RNI8_PAREQ
MGQKKEVFVVRLISVGSVEEGMLSVARKKLELEKEVTGANCAEDAESESQIVEVLLKKALSLEHSEAPRIRSRSDSRVVARICSFKPNLFSSFISLSYFVR